MLYCLGNIPDRQVVRHFYNLNRYVYKIEKVQIDRFKTLGNNYYLYCYL